MARTPEGKVKDQVVKLLKEFDVYYFFPSTHGYGRSGIPDLICCLHGGRFLAIECKAEGGLPTNLQVRELNRIIERQGMALVVTPKELPVLRLLIQENSVAQRR
jgi:Holliday junction resolvase